MNISGNTIFIPGATSGIGLALALALRARGRVKFLRYGEARGDYDQVVATLNQTDAHGR